MQQRMWTFGGTAPGPTLHGRVGDVFEVTLVNDDTGMGHGIDFHAGALAPRRPCARSSPASGWSTASVPRGRGVAVPLQHRTDAPAHGQRHVRRRHHRPARPAAGRPRIRTGLLRALPRYAGQHRPGDEDAPDTPDAWVFNGVADQYTRRPLKARAGERARFWVVAAGPERRHRLPHRRHRLRHRVQGGRLAAPAGPAGGAQVLDLATAQGGFVETTFPEAGPLRLRRPRHAPRRGRRDTGWSR